MIEIYLGLQIYKEGDDSLDKGDSGYQEYNDRDDCIGQVGFHLGSVIAWAEHTERTFTFKDSRQKVIVQIKGGDDITVIESFSDFTAIMEKFIEGTENPFITLGKN